ncbi:MAG: gamma-glutamyltransferase family protein [Myxococcota bacterium]
MSKLTDALDAAGSEAEPRSRAGAMIATSHPVAVEAGAEVLRSGGNAVDAAVTAAAVLGVVDPMSTGIGGDCFALVYEPEEGLTGINGSGRAGAALTPDRVGSSMPERGPLTVTVPGALHAWDALITRFGRRDLGSALSSAAKVARDGFEVTPVVGRDWARAEAFLRESPGGADWLVDGRAPRPGERFVHPAHASALDAIAKEGIGTFYGGAFGQKLARFLSDLGGALSVADLEAHESRWVEPLSTSYRGYPVYELPPNGQGMVVLEALALLDDFPLSDLPPEKRLHLTIEAIKHAFADARRLIGDPEHTPAAFEEILTEDWLEARRDQMGERARDLAPTAKTSDTVYVAVVDADGRACSLINSIYMHFGSGLVVPDTGITLQNRGALFSIDPDHPNAIGPSRRPYHTIIPSMVFRGGLPWLVFGVVGGFQQPQAQVQILQRLIDDGCSVVDAVAAPRFRWEDGVRVRLEEGLDKEFGVALRNRGHDVTVGGAGFGGAQAILVDRTAGTLEGASDPRKDGLALAVSEGASSS